MAKDKKEAQFKGVILAVIGIFIAIVGGTVQGIRITQYTEYGYGYKQPNGVISLGPLGWFLIIVGAAITIYGLYHLTSNI